MSNPASSSTAPTSENWNQLAAYVQTLGDEIKSCKAELEETKEQLAVARNQAALAGSIAAKPNKPTLFSGKPGTVEAWCSHMDSYVRTSSPGEACRIACTYLDGEAFNWWHTYRVQTDVPDWTSLRNALIRRFSPLNKVQAARNKLHSWRQIKDVATFNKSFLSIILDIPEITEEEKIDRYSRGLKREIWEPLCIRTYTELEALMMDALRVEAAKSGSARMTTGTGPSSAKAASVGAVPMDISSIKVQKLTPEERQRCMREGLCLRCREKGHLAKDCPKGQRN